MISNYEELLYALNADLVKVESEGHYLGEMKWLAFQFEMSLATRKRYSNRPEELKEIFKAVTGHTDCFCCGKPVFLKLVDDDTRIVLNRDEHLKKSVFYIGPCLYPNALTEEWNVEINCPSGKFILFNDLRRDLNGKHIFGDPKGSINTLYGIKQYSIEYARNGLGLIFVRNTCPSVIQDSEKKLTIASYWDEDEEDETDGAPKEDQPPKKEIGRICTDLWWYSIVDKDLFESKLGMTIEQYQEAWKKKGRWPELVVANVTPGTYKVSSRHHLVDDDDKVKVFSTVELME